MSNFHPLVVCPVVGRGSKTQPQVGENLNKRNEQNKGLTIVISFD